MSEKLCKWLLIWKDLSMVYVLCRVDPGAYLKSLSFHNYTTNCFYKSLQKDEIAKMAVVLHNRKNRTLYKQANAEVVQI